jgi:TatD DNase family protein
MYTDSHCHLNFPELQARLSDIRQDMQTAQVSRALLISTQLETFEDVHSITMAHDNFWCTAGVHPDEDNVQEPTLDDLLRLGQRDKVVGIGETGLDYYRLGERSMADMDWQRNRFRVHIRAARQLGLPLVIHTRSASADTLAILKEEGNIPGSAPATGVFHCFTGTKDQAEYILRTHPSFYFGLGGVLTYKNSGLAEVVKTLPLDRLVLETDAPYLPPTPHRGKRNEPSYLIHIADALSNVLAIPVAEVNKITSENARRLFNLNVQHL